MTEEEKKINETILKGFSPQFLANGIVGLFQCGEYESVEVRIMFHKKRAASAESQPAIIQQAAIQNGDKQ